MLYKSKKSSSIVLNLVVVVITIAVAISLMSSMEPILSEAFNELNDSSYDGVLMVTSSEYLINLFLLGLFIVPIFLIYNLFKTFFGNNPLGLEHVDYDKEETLEWDIGESKDKGCEDEEDKAIDSDEFLIKAVFKGCGSGDLKEKQEEVVEEEDLDIDLEEEWNKLDSDQEIEEEVKITKKEKDFYDADSIWGDKNGINKENKD